MKKINLENGLELELYDASKKVAGDRWLVKLIAKIDIPVKNYLEDMASDIDVKDVLKILGDNIRFEKPMERNFVDDKEKEMMLNGFLNTFIDTSVPYYSTLNFPKQLIEKKYKEAKFRINWYKE
jgi:hypothetical protein